MIMNLFSSRPEHPLGEPKELKRVLAELPLDNAFKTVDEIHGWLERKGFASITFSMSYDSSMRSGCIMFDA
jgi:hypothetical protein